MKRFFVFVTIIVVAVAIGFTTYYFTKDNEGISVDVTYYQKNAGESFKLDINHTKPKESTVITVTSSDESIIKYDATSNSVTTLKGGDATLTISTSNKNIKNVVIDVQVGDGSQAYPFYVRSADDLASIGTKNYSVTSYYMQTNDIDLSTYNSGEWVPIATEFNGVYDGSFFKISNLKMTGSDSSVVAAGIFSVIGSNGVVTRVNAQGFNINGSYNYAGAIAGKNKGLISLSTVAETNITNTSDSGDTGAVCGTLTPKTNDANADTPADQQASRPRIGKVAVYSSNITGNANVGGVVGESHGGYIFYVAAKGSSVTSSNTSANVGGIVGAISVVGNTDVNNSRVFESYSVMKITSTSTNTGNIVGLNAKSDSYDNYVVGCYFSNEINGTMLGIGNSTGSAKDKQIAYSTNGKANADLMNTSTNDVYVGYKDRNDATKLYYWDFEKVWIAVAGDYPEINFETGMFDDFPSFNDGTTIDSLTTLQNMDPKGEYEISADKDFQDGTFNTIAFFEGKLYGVKKDYDNNGTSRYPILKNFKISSNGLFDQLKGVVDGIIFENVTIVNTSSAGIIANDNSGEIKNITLQDCSIKASDSASDIYIGGIAAKNNNNIHDCVIKCTSTSTDDKFIYSPTFVNTEYISRVGGFVGQNSATITNCKRYGGNIVVDSKGTSIVGGVVGDNRLSVSYCSSECYTTSDSTKVVSSITALYSFSGNDFNTTNVSGGVVGYNKGGTINKSYAILNITGYNVGGVAGIDSGDINCSYFGDNEDISFANLFGHRVGGLISWQVSGNVTNCGTYCTISGSSNDAGGDGTYINASVKAGFVAFTENREGDSSMTLCFNACAFKGNGVAYEETASLIRTNGNGVKYGFINEVVFDNDVNGSATGTNEKVAYTWWSGKPATVKYAVSTAEAQGTTNNFASFDKANITSPVWERVSGYYPVPSMAVTDDSSK
jgi:hypothetical protein